MKTAQKGFTLVELLVVIAIIAILAAVVVLIINPIELQKRARDATRLSDLATLQNAITVATQENSSTAWFLCNATDPTPATTCAGDSGDTDASSAGGTGWVKINLAGQAAVKVPNLPLDPTNGTCGTETCVYSYTANATDWEINAQLESTQYQAKEEGDGGDDDAIYEVGSDPGLDLL
jgi:type IV pilus assembly protein PilA